MKGNLTHEYTQTIEVSGEKFDAKVMCSDEPIFSNSSGPCHTWIVISDKNGTVIKSLALPNPVQPEEAEGVFLDLKKIIESYEANGK